MSEESEVERIETEQIDHNLSEVVPEIADQEIVGEVLRLDHYLKSRGIAETGGQAKLMIQNGEVKLNGQVETRRRKKLVAGDVIKVNGKKFVIE